MASESDGEPPEVEYSSMKQPPLIKQLRGILSEYPDGGQIIKELLQNAEDANASEVKIVYDSRRINRDIVKDKPFRKFFQGPALCLYNDAVFTEQDWEGIQMIYSSVKEDDRQQVGRFGLGFKSVFHLTDYPCVISGDRVLFIDPQQPSDKVNAIMKLDKLTRYKGVDYEAFMVALEGTFNIDRNISTRGKYSGTILWFPLREAVSPISETLYNEEKVTTLFNMFKNEADNILIFLRSLTSISLHKRNNKSQMKEIANVKLVGNVKDVQDKRLNFKYALHQLQNNYSGRNKKAAYKITIETSIHDKKPSKPSTKTWMVVNMFIGESASTEFRALIQDPNIGNSPYVGVAVPILQGSDHREQLEGHVYCFLPLPKEGSRLTGLPVHINGFFALNQSRHHLKWQTDEQAGMAITDKDILWNRCLIEQAIPLAYTILVKRLIDHAIELKNPIEAVTAVYNVIPNIENATAKWKPLVQAVLTTLVTKTPFLYFKDGSNTSTESWITVTEATFATFRHPVVRMLNIKEAVIRTLLLIDLKFVDVPSRLFDSIYMIFDIEDLSPGHLGNFLQQRQQYKSLSDTHKLAILEYLMADNDYDKLSGLELLPLASVSWTTFQNHADDVHVCSADDLGLFPGLESSFVRDDRQMTTSLRKHFQEIGRKDMFQVRQFHVESFKVLVRKTVHMYMSRTGTRLISNSTPLTYKWLAKVWQFMLKNNVLQCFNDVSLVPKLKRGTWSGDSIEVELHCIIDTVMLQQYNGRYLPDPVADAIKCLNVVILQNLPDWFPKSVIETSMFIPTSTSIAKLFSAINNGREGVKNVVHFFNSNCGLKAREALVKHICSEKRYDNDAKKLLKKLAIFRQVESPNSKPDFVCLKINKNYIYRDFCQQFPIRYPYAVLSASTQEQELLQTLGASRIDMPQFLVDVVAGIQNGTYSQSEVHSFMKYVFENFKQVEKHSEVLDEIHQIVFLPTNSGYSKVSDLFNPFDEFLKQLFYSENRFPTQSLFSNVKHRHILERLGLKCIKNVTAADLIEVAETLKQLSSIGTASNSAIKTKANAFLEVLNKMPYMLDSICRYSYTLSQLISTIECIPVKENRDSTFPKCLPWYSRSNKLYKPCDIGNVKLCLLAGSTMPMFKPPTNLQTAFRWDELPAVDSVLNQLVVVKNEYTVKYKTEMLTSIKAIYRLFSLNECDFFYQHQNEITSRMNADELLWNGDGFCCPTKVIICSESQDLDLRPHFYLCPDEFGGAFEDLFIELGCRADQGVDILLQTLENLHIKHEMEYYDIPESIVKADISLANKILNRLATRLKELDGKYGKVLIPVQTIDENSKYCRLRMKSVDECVYDKENLFVYNETEDDAIQYFVHSDISCDTAKALGVKSVNLKALSETEGFEEWGQVETITARISSLLEKGYVDGLSVLKELMQNADDAGASTIKFLYDERLNDEAKQKLISSGMRDCQGPALWIYNDATFSKADLVNITNLNGGTKQNDPHKIGKFGLGFCSVYNLTDVPSFITGNDIVMFDPHMTYLQEVLLGKTPGLRIDLTKASHRALLRRHSDQFKPYEGIFGCSPLNSDGVALRGSLFRLPLRTFKQSQNNKISSKVYSKEEIVELLRMFISSAGNMFLFTQNVETLEIYHLPSEAKSTTDQSLLFSVKRDCFKIDGTRLSAFEGNVMEMAHRSVRSRQAVAIIQRRNIELTTTQKLLSIISGIDDKQMQLVSSWIIAWSSEIICPQQFSQNTTIPLSAIAIPCCQKSEFIPEKIENLKTGFYQSGHVFCFLPLPVTTHLPVHINGYFDVSDDRRQLRALSEDDKMSIQCEWNKYLLKGSLVHSFILLLKTLALRSPPSYVFHCLWPNYIESDDVTKPFTVQFYRTIVNEDYSLYKAKSKWISFKDAVFLDTKIQSDRSIGNIALEMLQTFIVRDGKSLVDLPVDIFLAMRRATESQNLVVNAVITEEEMLTVALRNLEHEFWNDKYYERNTLILRALKSKSSTLFEIMCNIKCIPVEPSGTLREPNDIVNPNSELAQLFTVEDGRNLTKDKRFHDRKIINKLLDLEMINRSLPEHCLIERCYSVQSIAEQCCQCAYERSCYILRYLNDYNIQQRTKVDIKNEIQTIDMLPVLSRPTSWKFNWQSDTSMSLKRISQTLDGKCVYHPSLAKDTIVLGKPIILYRQYMADFVGSIEIVVDESRCKDLQHSEASAFTFLGVKSITQHEPCIDKLVEQIIEISNGYNDKDEQFSEVSRLHQKIFNQFKSCIQFDQTSSCTDLLAVLQSEKVILVGSALLFPRNVVYDLKEDCFPDLVQLPRAERLHRKSVYNAVGVRTSFPISDIITVLQKKKDKWNGIVCKELEVVGNLLVNLKYSMDVQKLLYTDLHDTSDCIVCPDVKGILRPTYDLIFDDDSYKTRSNMHILHESIPAQLAYALGVKPKHKKSLQHISCGIPFGQREKLVTRLKKLLSSYHCDSSIMKELLQNADDAGATEIHFVTDYRTHGGDLNFGNAQLQGPSLFVFNDSYFTESDFKGIHNLGEGSKGDDPTKTGQYGVGFNAVYHLTDTPAFLTKGPRLKRGETLCIFDPLCSNLQGTTEDDPGMLYKVDGLREDFPNALNGYSDFKTLFKDEIGTLFRFPLRCVESELSKATIAKKELEEILASFKTDMFDSLLFLKHINCIKISDISTGKMCLKNEVRANMSTDDMQNRVSFFKTVKAISNENIKNKIANLTYPQIKLSYKIQIKDHNSLGKEFYVVQCFGFGDYDFPEDVSDYFKNGSLGHLPLGGIAMPCENFVVNHSTNTRSSTVDADQKENKANGKVFCVLPLPLHSGLPLHVNGHFSLDQESRRELGKKVVQRKWNECLIDCIIVPAYVSTLHFVQDCYVDSQVKMYLTWSSVKTLLAKYHDMFPVGINVDGIFWKRAIHSFYKFVLDKKSQLFPVITNNYNTMTDAQNRTQRCFELHWTSITDTDSEFLGVFNVIEQFLPRPSYDLCNLDRYTQRQKVIFFLSDVLKRIGIKLISTPGMILKTIEQAGFQGIQQSDPKFVMDFLSTFEDDRVDGCRIGNCGIDLTKTKFENIQSLNTVAEYVMLAKDYQLLIQGLPILLTVDRILRKCSTTQTVYNSECWSLFQNSRSEFVQESQLILFGKHVLFEKKIVNKLGLKEVLNLLPISLDPQLLAKCKTIPWNKTTGMPLTSKWIQMFISFIYKESLQKSPSNYGSAIIDHEQFQRNIDMFKQWSIVPTTECSDFQSKDELFPVSNLSFVYFRGYDSDSNLLEVIDKFNFPFLDTTVFGSDSSIIYAMQKLVASTDKPAKLFACLLHYKDRISLQHLNEADSVTLLSFFGRHIKHLIETVGSTFKQKLRSLPLFPSLLGTLCRIDQDHEVYVLPHEMPKDGIETFANSTRCVFLKHNDSFKDVYQYLGMSVADIDGIYLNIILPKIKFLPRENWIPHIIYVRDCLLKRTVDLSHQQKQLISVLKQVPFLNIRGNPKRVDQLYSIDNEVFKVMLDESDFAPAEFRTPEWTMLFEDLGLTVEPSPYMIVAYAKEVQSIARNGVHEGITRKSSVLVEFLITSTNFPDGILQELSTIRFVVPYKVSERRRSVSQQLDDGQLLICFKNAVSSKHEDLCWTSTNLIPERICRSGMDSCLKSLGICDIPSVKDVLTHCQNVCEILSSRTLGENFLKRQMTQFYEFFEKYETEMQTIKQRLQYTKCIYIPDDKTMVEPSKTVLHLSSVKEIKPFLYHAPTYFGMYHKLFLKIGSQENVTCSSYANVLKSLKTKVGNDPLMHTELRYVKLALRNLVHLLMKDSDPSVKDLTELFLPNRDAIFARCETLTVSNNFDIEKRIGKNIEMNYFIGFRELEISTTDVADQRSLFNRLPRCVRPSLLTDVVKETVCLDNIEEVESVNARHIETFLHSSEFIDGVLRLAQNSCRNADIATDTDYFNDVVSCIETIKVKCVGGLVTTLSYKNILIKDTVREKECFITKTQVDGKYIFTIYISHEYKNEIDMVKLASADDGLIELIQRCCGNRITTVMTLCAIMLAPVSDIADILDKKRIDEFNCSIVRKRSVFPRPGTYVEKIFHPFLEQGISEFEPSEYEFVALELEDDVLGCLPELHDRDMEEADDDVEPLYIYVHIIRPEPRRNNSTLLHQKYLIYTGDLNIRNEIVPIYRLYRFVRKTEDVGTEIVKYDNEPLNPLMFDENCERVRNMLREAWNLPELEKRRIYRRLLLKWHPDRNRNNEEYATRVFNYLQYIMLRLERREEIDDSVDNNTGRRCPDGSGSMYNGMTCNLNNRATIYARAYHNNINEYNTSNRTGNYSHVSAAKAIRPDPREAKRWLRQAKCDFQSAVVTISDVEAVRGHNWICYICHQASEKALKAAVLSKDGNSSHRMGHSLSTISRVARNDELHVQAVRLESLLGEHTRMRYPDSVSRPSIPSELFSTDDAKEALEITKNIIDLVDEYME